MKLIEKTLYDYSISYPLEYINTSTDKILFFDIETTGLSSTYNSIYMIGCQYYQNNYWHNIQWFAEVIEDEPLLLQSFFNFITSYDLIIHFNGKRFDIPFVIERCKKHQIFYNFERFHFIDIYEKLLQLKNLRQTTLENYLGIYRDDEYDGGELISVYEEYLTYPEEDLLDTLLLHNAEDIQCLPRLLPLLSLEHLFEGHLKVKKVQTNTYTNIQGLTRQELIITLNLQLPFPQIISIENAECYLKIEDTTATIKVPIYSEELKYFYADYKNYYYLPAEDTALHKSVASFVDIKHRQQATATNCYTKKSSHYLPQWQPIVTPFFKRAYEDKELFFEVVDEIKRDRKLFTNYTIHLLAMFLFHKK